MAAPTPFQHLQVPPLQRHPKQHLVLKLRCLQPHVVCHLLQHLIEVISVAFGGEGKDVKEGEKTEGSGCLGQELGCRIPSMTQKLNLLRLCTFTPAVIYVDVVNAVGVEYLKPVRPRNRV
jgi:hypothetical protein